MCNNPEIVTVGEDGRINLFRADHKEAVRTIGKKNHLSLVYLIVIQHLLCAVPGVKCLRDLEIYKGGSLYQDSMLIRPV